MSASSPGPGASPRARFAELGAAGRTLVMGIVNVTPDSFSDGGRWLEPEVAVGHARLLRRQGADVLDVGGESTRPGSERVPVDVELARVLPVVRALAADGAPVSVDTVHAETAEACLRAGATFVNDVSGGLADPAMAEVVARTGVAYVCMHWRGHADVMDTLEDYDDVVTDVRDELAARVEALLAAGVRRQVNNLTSPPPRANDVWAEAIRQETEPEAPVADQVLDIARETLPQVGRHLSAAGALLFGAMSRSLSAVERSLRYRPGSESAESEPDGGR